MGYDEAAKYFFTVTNRGEGAAGPFTVDVPGEGTFEIPGLAPGASATRTFRTACKVATQQAIADALAQVDESDESNNTRTFAETVCLTGVSPAAPRLRSTSGVAGRRRTPPAPGVGRAL
jgi:subtilase family serine protease